MATATAPSASQNAETLSSARPVAWGLFWGSLMLFTMALWLRAKHADLSIFWLFLLALLGLGWLGLVIRHGLTGARQTAAPQEKGERLAKERQIIGQVLMASGFLLLLFGAALGYWYRLGGFGESVGLVLFALVVMAIGRGMTRPSAVSAGPAPLLEGIRKNRTAVSLSLMIVGGLLILTAVGLVFIQKVGWAGFPEVGGLLLLGLLFWLGSIGLFLTAGADLSIAKVRSLVLVVGGVAGLIITLATLSRAILWRQDVFLGGLGAWQGSEGWRVWLCAYTGIIGLALMFGSLLLGMVDVRAHAVLRRVLYGYNALLTGLLFLAILIVFNIVFYTLFPYSFDWTKTRGLHALAPSSKELLNNLTTPTTVYVLLPDEPIYKDVRHLLDNCQAQSNMLQVKYVSPDKEFKEYDKIASRFPEIIPEGKAARMGDESGRGLLVVYGEMPEEPTKKPPYAFIPERRILDRSFNRNAEGARATLVFKGEGELMKELDFLVKGKQTRKIYFLQGNQELDINGAKWQRRPSVIYDLSLLGAEVLMDNLKKENYEVAGLSFGIPVGKEKKANLVYAAAGADKKKAVPKDAYAVVILGPSSPLSKETLDALESYMDQGGRLLVFVDVVTDRAAKAIVTTGLEDFLKKYGVQVGTEYAMRVDFEINPLVVFANVPADTKNTLAKQFLVDRMPFMTARVVRPDPAANKFKAEVLLQLQLQQERGLYYWSETSMKGLRDPDRYLKELNVAGALENRISTEPIPIAVTVSEDGTKPRMVVFGDAEFVSDVQLAASKYRNLYYSLAVGSLEWMAEKPGRLGPPPKESSTFALGPNVELGRMILVPGWLMTLAVFGLGMGVWLVRRR